MDGIVGWKIPLKLTELEEKKERVGNGNVEEKRPAALLAEALAEAGDDNDGGLGVGLAHLVPPVVPLGLRQIGGALLRLAARLGRPPAARSPPGRGGSRSRSGGPPLLVLLLPGRDLLLVATVGGSGGGALPGLLLPAPLGLRGRSTLHGDAGVVGRREGKEIWGGDRGGVGKR